jgi:hypothetical protein
MNFFRANVPPSRVPTLTEVVDFGSATEPAGEAAAADFLSAEPTRTDVFDGAAVPVAAAPLPTVLTAIDAPNQEELTRQVLTDVQRQVDALLEYRMKEVLAPVITRLTDALARDTRAELAAVLKDVVTRAVAQEIAKRQTK